MGTVESILKEEIARLSAVQRSYIRGIKKLPKGSIQIKRIKGITYPYLAAREGKKVVSVYVGHYSPRKLEALKKAIIQRRKYEHHLKKAKHNLKRVSRMIRGKRKKAV